MNLVQFFFFPIIYEEICAFNNRLTPLYMFAIGITEIGNTYLSEITPFTGSIMDRNHLTCGIYWWRNIFYIQNLFPLNEYCLPWTWSLASEMQYFILSTILFFLYTK